jgi:hypothetical protein
MASRVKVSGGIYRAQVPAGAVYVGRAWPRLFQSPWANPWCVIPGARLSYEESKKLGDPKFAVRHHRDSSRIVGGYASRADALSAAVAMFRQHLDSRPDLVESARVGLAGKDLACWCKPDEPCHADVLLEIANRPGGGS